MKDSMVITCSNCKKVLPTQFTTCGQCGGVEKTVHLKFYEAIGISDQLKTKEIEGTGKRKVRREMINGYNRSANGELVYKERIVDRRNDSYYEKVVDSGGNTIRFCDEKLSEHQKRGSDRQSKSNDFDTNEL